MLSRIVLIGPADALPALRDRLDPAAEVQTFSDHEALEALDHIIRTKPGVIAMQEEFSASSRGIALINRIEDDPALSACEVRVLARDAAKPRVAVKRGTSSGGGGGGAAIAVDEPSPALDVKGTRRAPRIRIKDGVEVAVDGNPAALVDLSTFGAQVVSATVLKPNQRVRITMSDGKIRCAGAVAWASFEMPKGAPTRYRAGIDFGTSADASSVTKFAQKHKQDKDKDR